jgi:NADP-reducing hydrogenase subunit HndB
MKSLDELRKIKEEVQKTMQARKAGHGKKIIIGMGTCGIAAGARDTMKAFISAIDKAGIDDVAVTVAGCEGFCEQEPLVSVEIAGEPMVKYGKIDAAGAEKIVSEHLLNGNIVSELQFA